MATFELPKFGFTTQTEFSLYARMSHHGLAGKRRKGKRRKRKISKKNIEKKNIEEENVEMINIQSGL
jgi:hypothetical protein